MWENRGRAHTSFARTPGATNHFFPTFETNREEGLQTLIPEYLTLSHIWGLNRIGAVFLGALGVLSEAGGYMIFNRQDAKSAKKDK